MRFVKAIERLPEVKNPPYLVIVRWVTKGEHLSVATMTPNQLADKLRGDITGVYEWLDGSLPACIEQEAEKQYPYNRVEKTMEWHDAQIIDLKREVFCETARQYMDTIEKLRAENEKMAEAVEILTELCALKKYKDSVGKDSHYEQEQPKAWKRANEFLNRIATSALK